MSQPITVRYPQLVEAFEFIKDEYVWARLPRSKQPTKDTATAAATNKAANTKTTIIANTKTTIITGSTDLLLATDVANKLAMMKIIDFWYTTRFPDLGVFVRRAA